MLKTTGSYYVFYTYSKCLVVLFLLQIILFSLHIYALSDDLVWRLSSTDSSTSRFRELNLTYDMVVVGGSKPYVDFTETFQIEILDPHYNSPFKLKYKVDLYLVKNPNLEIGDNYSALILNETPACLLFTNKSIRIIFSIHGAEAVVTLLLNKSYLICNVKPWFQVLGDLSLGTLRYFNKSHSLYMGFVYGAKLQARFLIDFSKWALFSNNTYVGDILFLIDRKELGLNATILLVRHSDTITCKVNNSKYPTSVLVYINYTKHPLTDFEHNNIKVNNMDISLGDYFKPALNNIKIINPPMELLKYWVDTARKYSMKLIDYGNNTYLIANMDFGRIYEAIDESRYWRLKYIPIELYERNEMKFYRFRPFVVIDGEPYCIVPSEDHIDLLYDVVNGVMLELSYTESIQTLTRVSRILPPDILLHGMGINSIRYPYGAKLSIKASTINIGVEDKIELGGKASIHLDPYNVLSIIVAIVLVLFTVIVLSYIKRGHHS